MNNRPSRRTTRSVGVPATPHARTCRAGEPKLCCVESLRLRDGRRLSVRRWRGQDQGTLVVLHGMLDSSEGWDALSTRVSCSILAFDLPGFGHSDAPVQSSIAGYAQDVADGLEMLGVQRFTLVGHSLGGAVATALAELLPDKVAALVLLAPVGFGRNHLAGVASLPVARNLVQTALPWALSSRTMVTATYLTMVTNGSPPDPMVIDRITRNRRSLVDGTRKALDAIMDASGPKQVFSHRRVAYDGPVVAVWGDCDRLVPPSHRDGVRAALPQAEIHLWAGMGHHPLIERFDDLAVLLANAAAPLDAREPPGRQSAAVTDLPLADAA